MTNNKGKVYIIPTPIGNMRDITLRALDVLKELKVVFSEDTRETYKFLNEYDISTTLLSNHEHNEKTNTNKLFKFLDKGIDVGIVSDRGTPLISDPGFGLVRAAILNGYYVTSLPGATAFVPALTLSNFNSTKFTFLGFLSDKSGRQKEELIRYVNSSETLIMYISPHKVHKLLENILHVFGNRNAVIVREISKKFEEVIRGTVSDLLLKETYKGELVFIVEGHVNVEKVNLNTAFLKIDYYVRNGLESGLAIKLVSKEMNFPKSTLYKEYVEWRK